MTERSMLPPEEPPRDDFEAADTIDSVLTAYTDTDDPMDLPEDVRAELDGWMEPYLKRREAESGVSPIAPRILPYFLTEFDMKWDHRMLQDNVGQKVYRALDHQLRGPAINVRSMRGVDKVTSELRRYGWELNRIKDGDADYKALLEFEPQQHDVEVLRRLRIGGLDHDEAIAYWLSEVADLTQGGSNINTYLPTDKGTVDRLALTARVLDVSEATVESALEDATEKLSEIDPGLPEFFRSGTGGHPLPDELWAPEELARLEAARQPNK